MKKFKLELSEDEVRMLFTIARSVSGHCEKSPRKFSDQIYNKIHALSGQDKIDDLRLYDNMITGDLNCVNFPKKKSPLIIRHYRRDATNDPTGLTVAFVIDYMNGTLEFGYAICAKDMFDKAIGRSIALKRLEAVPFIIRYNKALDLMQNFKNVAPVILPKSDFKLLKKIGFIKE